MIEINPYSNIDFGNHVRVLSNTHEHVMNQAALEWVWNKGVRNINPSNYQPSSPVDFTTGYQYDYNDFTSAEDMAVITKLGPDRRLSDFTDANNNFVRIADIVSLPNAERVNIQGYNYMLHSNYLGSTFGDPGWMTIEGIEISSTVSWRSQHKFLTTEQLFNGIRSNLMFEGKVFGTLNHPRSAEESYESVKDFVTKSNGLIQGVEVYSSVLSPSDMAARYIDTYDRLLNDGFRLWALAVTDWPHLNLEEGVKDYGCNQLLLPSDYESLTYVQKQEAILDCYIAGQYFPVGLGTLTVEDFTINGNEITVTFNKSCNIKAVVDGVEINKGTATSATQIMYDNAKYVRFYAQADDGDFVFTNPVFSNYRGTSDFKTKMIVLGL